MACTSQLIVTTLIQAVKLLSMVVTRLLFRFVLFALVKVCVRRWEKNSKKSFLFSYFNSVASQINFYNEIVKTGWLLHCSTGCLRRHEASAPCSISLSNNSVIVKACSRNAMGSINLAYSEKSTYKFLSGFPFKIVLHSLVKKVRTMHLLCDRALFYSSSLNFCYSRPNYITTAY